MKNEKKNEKVKGGEFIDPKFADASDIRDIIDNPFDLPLIDEYMNGSNKKVSVLTNFSIESSEFGPFVILEFNGDFNCRSGGKAIVSQCQRIFDKNEHCPIRVCIEKCSTSKGDYFSLLGSAD